MRNKILFASFALLALTAILFACDRFGLLHISAQILLASRWAFLATLLGFGLFKRNLTTWILIAMLIGAEIGHDWPSIATNLRLISLIFLRMIKVIIAPLLFATLVSGIAAHSDLKRVGRLGIKSLIYFELVTTVALLIGLGAINLSKAGVGVKLPPAPASELVATKTTASEVILHVFPENIAKSVAENQVLQIVVFSIIFGIGLAMVRDEKRRPVLAFTEGLAEVMFKFTNIVMLFAPFGVGAAMAYTVGHTGIGILANLFKLLATMYIALGAFLVVVLLPIAYFARVPVRRFIAATAGPASIAFATTSSEAALPRAMEAMEGIGVPRQIVSFVIPTGYSFNLDGSTMYLSLASVFVAQAAGVHMTIGQQVVMMLTLMLTSKGVAGVSRASLVILLGTVGMFNLPVEPVFILLGIDELMDMARTSVNVIGNCLASCVVARWEGELAEESGQLAIGRSGHC